MLKKSISALVGMSFVVSILVMSLPGCGGGGGGSGTAATGGGGVGVTTTAAVNALPVTFNPPIGTPLTPTSTLSITFAGAMNPASSVMAPATGAWSAGNTVYTIPAAVIAAASSVTVSVNATAATGSSQVSLNNIVYNVYGGTNPFVYVSPAGNDATGSGTLAAPFATIAKGIASAVSGQAVLVAGGTYSVNSGAATPTNVVLKDGVSLYGGYAPNFGSRDPVANVTTITDIASTSAATPIATDYGTAYNTCGLATAGTPRAAVSVGALTQNVMVDGFTVNGSTNAATVDSAAISINNTGVGSVVLTNSTLNGGAGSAFSVGVYSTSGTYYLGGDTVNGGSSAGTSLGVYTANGIVNALYSTINAGSGALNAGVFNDDLNSVTANLSNSVIAGGSGANSYGVYSVPNCPAGTAPVLVNDTISGGSGTATSTGVYAAGWVYQDIFDTTVDGGSGQVSTGINVADWYRNTNVWNSTVSGGSGTTSSTAIANNGGNSTLDTVTTTDSILFVAAGAGSRVCYTNASGVAADIFNNNDVSPSCATALYSYKGVGVTTLATMTTINAASSTLATAGNVSANPMFASSSDWHLTAGSPAEVQQGGLNKIGVMGQNIAEPATNKDGAVRTPSMTLSPANAGAAGISMGAY